MLNYLKTMSSVSGGGGGDRPDSSSQAEVKVETEEETQQLAKTVHQHLKSYESVALHLQRLLLWENPLHSVVFLAVVELFFVYVVSRSNHIIGFTSTVFLCFVWLDVWKDTIWPEIRAEEPSPDNEWGELNPQLMSFHDMCEKIAGGCLYLRNGMCTAFELRKQQPGKFAIISSCCCLIAVVAGNIFSGIVMSQCALIAMAAWPVMLRFKLFDKTLTSVEPYLIGLQYSLKPQVGGSSSGDSGASHVATLDEDFISELVPQLDDNATAEVLAKALTDDVELSEADKHVLASELPSFAQAAEPMLGVLPASQMQANSKRKETAAPHQLRDLSDSEEDELGFVPHSSHQQAQVTTPPVHDNILGKIVNDVVTATAASNIEKMVQDGLAGFSQMAQQAAAATDTRRYSTSSSSDFEVLDSMET